MNKSLGQLPNAPLIYVLAQLVFSRVPNMVEYWEDFHKAIFNSYPESLIEDVNKLSLRAGNITPQQERRWHMLSSDKRQGVILNADSLVFHTTKYTKSVEFFSELENIINVLVNVLPSQNIQVSRTGLRYLDLLIPHKDISVDKQVTEKLSMVDLSEIQCEPIKFERVENFRTIGGGELVIRHRQTTGTDILPSDLFPNNLELAPLMIRDRPEGVVGALDYDHFMQEVIPLDTKPIIDRFRNLHTATSAAFRLTTTENAMKIWKVMNNVGE